MKKRLQKITTLFLSTAMTVAMLAGCGNSGGNTQSDAGNSGGADTPSGENSSAGDDGSGSAGTIDTSEHVDLKMYLIGDRTPDFDEVYGEINKILEEKLNCSISVEFLSWGELLSAVRGIHPDLCAGYLGSSSGSGMAAGDYRRTGLYGAQLQQ